MLWEGKKLGSAKFSFYSKKEIKKYGFQIISLLDLNN